MILLHVVLRWKCSFCRAGGLRDMSRVVICSNECYACFGSPRPQAEALELFNSLPEDKKQAARKWQIKLYQVITGDFKILVSALHDQASLVIVSCKDAPHLAQATSNALSCHSSHIHAFCTRSVVHAPLCFLSHTIAEAAVTG